MTCEATTLNPVTLRHDLPVGVAAYGCTVTGTKGNDRIDTREFGFPDGLVAVSVKPGDGEDMVIVADGIISGVDNTKKGSTTLVTGGVIEASGAALQYLERSTLLRRYVGARWCG